MISLSDNSQPFYLKDEHLRHLRSTKSVTILFIALLLVLVFSERCPADARYNYDTQNYDAQNYNSLRNLVRELTTSPFASQNTRHTDRLTRATPAEYDTCQICCIVTVSKTYLRHALSLRLLLQNHSFALIANYSASTSRALETHRLLTNYGMSQYRAYFVPGAVDPDGLKHPDGSPTKHGEVGGPNSAKNVFEWMVTSAHEAGVKVEGHKSDE